MHLLARGKNNVRRCIFQQGVKYFYSVKLQHTHTLFQKVFKSDSSLNQILISNTFSISCLYDRKTNLYSTAVRQGLLVFGNQFSWSLSPPSPVSRAFLFDKKFSNSTFALPASVDVRWDDTQEDSKEGEQEAKTHQARTNHSQLH